jgi:hypothetical protein
VYTKREQSKNVNGGIMDNFERRGLSRELADMKERAEEIERRLKEDEENEILGVKRMEMRSDRDARTFYTVSRIVSIKWHCTCPDNRYRAPGECKHIQRAQVMPLWKFE